MMNEGCMECICCTLLSDVYFFAPKSSLLDAFDAEVRQALGGLLGLLLGRGFIFRAYAAHCIAETRQNTLKDSPNTESQGLLRI